MMICSQSVITRYRCHDYLWYIGCDKHNGIIQGWCIKLICGWDNVADIVNINKKECIYNSYGLLTDGGVTNMIYYRDLFE